VPFADIPVRLRNQTLTAKWNAKFTGGGGGRITVQFYKPLVDRSLCCFETMWETSCIFQRTCPIIMFRSEHSLRCSCMKKI